MTPLFLLHHSPKIFKIRRIMLPGRPTLIFTNGHWVINILVFVNVHHRTRQKHDQRYIKLSQHWRRGITQPILKLPIILRFQPGYILQTWGMYRFHLSINQIASQEESAINQLLAGLQGVKDSSHFISLNLLLGNKTFRKLL